MQEHIERLNRHIEQGTLIRGAWQGTDAQGRETACLLAAMAPECGAEETANVCPAAIMPSWLAHLTPCLDDNGSLDAWPSMVKRFSGLAARWHTLDAAGWRRVQFTWLAASVREAAVHTKELSALMVCERVAALCDAVVDTGAIDDVAFGCAKEAVVDVDDGSWAVAAALSEAATAAARAARATVAEHHTAIRHALLLLGVSHNG